MSQAGPSGAGAAAPQGGAGGQMSQQNLNQIVIEYLSKKGYTRTEAMLRAEATSQNTDGIKFPQESRLQDDKRHGTAYELVEKWVELQLDIYKPELQRLLWPLLVYSYLKSVSKDWAETSDASNRAQIFLSNHKERFEPEHRNDLNMLQAIKLDGHVTDSQLAQTFLKNKYRYTISRGAWSLLIQFLEDKQHFGGTEIMAIITENMDIKVQDRVASNHNVVESILARGEQTSQWPAEDEGIPGHAPGHYAGAPSANMVKLRLGPLPMEPDLLEDVMAELEEEDAKTGPIPGRLTLVQEFQNRIKQEDPDEHNQVSRLELPLPASTAKDVLFQVLQIKELRDRFELHEKKDELSVCMYTFHNAQETVNCVKISDDCNLIAVGTAEHHIRVFTTDGSPLPQRAQETKMTSSEKLYGHRGPIFNLSFSPAVTDPENDPVNFNPPNRSYTGPEFLLSCSMDNTIRLWHLGIMRCIMVYKAHLFPVYDVTWGPYGHYFASVGHDKKAHLWSTAKAAPIKWFTGSDQPMDYIDFHPNGAYIFTFASDRAIRMFNCVSGQCVRLFTSHTGMPTVLRCSPTGKLLASADDQGVILIWDLASGHLMKRMKGHNGTIWDIAWNPDGLLLLSGGEDGTVRMWDVMKMDNISATSKIVGEGNISTGASGSTTAATGTSASQGKKKSKGLQVSADQISCFATKQTPVRMVKFTRMNLGLAAGSYQGKPES